jgi:hypothetical protein
MYGAENDINVYRITSSWDESNVNFNNQPSIDSTIINTTRVFNENETWILWNITDLVGGWSSGIYPNYGLMLKGDSHAKYFYSSDKDNETVRPKLIITYSAPTYTGVSGCANITQQGMYRLTANITNSNENTCFYVNVSDVEFDCQNNIIDGVDKGLSYGFYANPNVRGIQQLHPRLRSIQQRRGWSTHIKQHKNELPPPEGGGIYEVKQASVLGWFAVEVELLPRSGGRDSTRLVIGRCSV